MIAAEMRYSALPHALLQRVATARSLCRGLFPFITDPRHNGIEVMPWLPTALIAHIANGAMYAPPAGDGQRWLELRLTTTLLTSHRLPPPTYLSMKRVAQVPFFGPAALPGVCRRPAGAKSQRQRPGKAAIPQSGTGVALLARF
jgi:hypothetical protein